MDIDLSGGSITRRQFLSTAQFTLSKFLLMRGYNNKDLYKGIEYYKKFKEKISTSDLESNDSTLLKLVIFNELNKKIVLLIDNKEFVEGKFINKKSNITDLQHQIEVLNKDIYYELLIEPRTKSNN